MPTKFNRWGKPQNYDPSTGRYGEGEKSKSKEFGNFKKPKGNVVELSSDNELSKLIATSDRSKYKVIIDYIKRNFGGREFTFSDGIKAIIDNKDAEELTHKANARKTAEISLLNEIVKNAVFENEIDINHKKFSKMRYYVAKTRLKEKDRLIWLNIGLEKNGNKYHLYDMVPKK